MSDFELMLESIAKDVIAMPEVRKQPEEERYGVILDEVREDLNYLDIDVVPSNLPEIIADLVSGRDKRGLYFVGGVGTGKTRRAKALASILGCHYYTAQEVCRIFCDDRNVFEEKMFKQYYCEGVPHYNDIIIDDLGTELREYQVYGIKFDVMGDLLQRRYDMFPKCATHITTNLNKTELINRYGERIHSRFNEMMRPVKLAGADRRLTINQK